MSNELLSIFQTLNNMSPRVDNRDWSIIRAPFSYAGGKSRSIKQILPHLPYRDVYVEPFGGSMAVLLGRERSSIEVYNDAYGGVVCFYKCLRDKAKCEQLIDRLKLTCYSREEFIWCKDTWEDPSDEVERAARWYYLFRYSFGGLGRNFARTLTTTSMNFGKLFHQCLETFVPIHNRIKQVIIENLDWEIIMCDYANPKTVFYIDPPYLDTYQSTYKSELSLEDHRKLLNYVMTKPGFYAVSSYENDLYLKNDWDDVVTWEANVTIKSVKESVGARRENTEYLNERDKRTEFLFIKDNV